MTKPIHPRVAGPRIRRTKAQMAAARAEVERNQRLAAQTAEVEACLALASPRRREWAERYVRRYLPKGLVLR